MDRLRTVLFIFYCGIIIMYLKKTCGTFSEKGDDVMAYEITSDCIKCGKCEFVCPEDAIKRGWTGYKIDPDLCDSCGGCTYVCPVKAIEPD